VKSGWNVCVDGPFQCRYLGAIRQYSKCEFSCHQNCNKLAEGEPGGPLCDLLFSVFYERLKGTHDFCDFCVARFTAAMGLVLSCSLNRFGPTWPRKKEG